MNEAKCLNGYTSYSEYEKKFMVNTQEGEKCLKCPALEMDNNEGLILCSKFNKED